MSSIRPTEVARGIKPFERLAEDASRFTGPATSFVVCLLLVAVAVVLHLTGLPVRWLGW
ncbi:hypothetical protein ACFTZK_00130 [Streptomyces decoyicus]|uniref:hypothetical protein n=1 Tax=Streptomyces decoyicus TaxID=249567 RepID=UPI00362CF96C